MCWLMSRDCSECDQLTWNLKGPISSISVVLSYTPRTVMSYLSVDEPFFDECLAEVRRGRGNP